MTNVNDAWIGNLVRHWREDPGASYQTWFLWEDGQGFP
jgi:type II restriction enzyme